MKNEVEILRVSYMNGIIVENSILFDKLCLMVTCLQWSAIAKELIENFKEQKNFQNQEIGLLISAGKNIPEIEKMPYY